jgi:hypothetical protein
MACFPTLCRYSARIREGALVLASLGMESSLSNYCAYQRSECGFCHTVYDGSAFLFHTTVKAFFFLSLISSIGVFAALGLETMCWQLGRLRWLLYGNLAALYGIIFYLFWY